jgi:hypothetical protein
MAAHLAVARSGGVAQRKANRVRVSCHVLPDKAAVEGSRPRVCAGGACLGNSANNLRAAVRKNLIAVEPLGLLAKAPLLRYLPFLYAVLGIRPLRAGLFFFFTCIAFLLYWWVCYLSSWCWEEAELCAASGRRR